MSGHVYTISASRRPAQSLATAHGLAENIWWGCPGFGNTGTDPVCNHVIMIYYDYNVYVYIYIYIRTYIYILYYIYIYTGILMSIVIMFSLSTQHYTFSDTNSMQSRKGSPDYRAWSRIAITFASGVWKHEPLQFWTLPLLRLSDCHNWSQSYI